MRNPFKAGKSEPASWFGTKGKDRTAPAGLDFAERMSQGRNLERVGKYAEARETFEKPIVARPTRHEPYHRLGVVAARQRRFSEAQALYAQAIRLEPKDPTYGPARRALASFEQFEKDPDRLASNSPMVENGVRWVPYSEGDDGDSGVIETAMYRSSAPAERIVPSTRPSTRAELQRARSFMSRRTNQTVLR